MDMEKIRQGEDRGRAFVVYVVRRASRQWIVVTRHQTRGGHSWAVAARRGVGGYMDQDLDIVLAEDVRRYRTRREAVAAAE